MLCVGRFLVRPVPGPLDRPVELAKPVAAPAPLPVSEEETEAPLVGINVHAELIDFCAQIRQTQRFRNNEETALEATFEFELPKGCAVSSFQADIGDRHLSGTVKEKEEAKEEYDDALAAGHCAGLMYSKDEDPNTFCLELGNVASGAEAFVTVTYEVLATMEDNKLVLTLNGSDAESVNFAPPPADTPDFDARVRPGFHFDVHIATNSAVKTLSSPSHPVSIHMLDKGEAEVRLAEGANWKENKNFVLEVEVEDPHKPSVRVQKFDDTQFAMVSFYPKVETPQTKCEMIFVLDCSGSMSGSAINRAKETLVCFIDRLPKEAYFNIVSFQSNFELFKSESVPVNEENLKEAKTFVAKLRAGGGTNIYDPLTAIFQHPIKPGYPRQVFILTDGEVEDKEECINLVRENSNTTRLFSFGIGNYVDMDLVNCMARAGQGKSCFVCDSSSVRDSVMNQLERALQPGLTHIRVQWFDAATDKPIADGQIRQTPYNPPPIFCGSRLVTFAILPEKCPVCKIVLTGSFGDSSYTSEVVFDPTSTENTPGEQIVKLGVRSMIEDIQTGCGGISLDKPEQIKKAVVPLSVKFGILSEFTAFVVDTRECEALQDSMVTRRVTRKSEYERVRMMSYALKYNTSLIELNLGCKNIGDEEAGMISDALKCNTTLTTLNLESNYIGDEGAKMISDALKCNTTLTRLNLGDNDIGAEGAKMISDALKCNTTLTELYLWDNSIGACGAHAICEPLIYNTMNELHLNGNNIGDEGAKMISDALKRNTALTLLDLSDNNIGDEGARMISDALKCNTTLTELNLQCNNIGDAAKEQLRRAWGPRDQSKLYL